MLAFAYKNIPMDNRVFLEAIIKKGFESEWSCSR